jgi:cytoskeletal protein RodZ
MGQGWHRARILVAGGREDAAGYDPYRHAMTARDQVRLGQRRLADRDRTAVVEAIRPPTLGQVLLAARERKGVDLYRAERDTKIRAKYLEALEQGDFRALPGQVYTKGFLRNYALYLGLDPDGVLEQWKGEVGTRLSDRSIVVPPPRPLETPRTGLTFTPGIIVAAALTLGVLAFAGYIALQLFRFSQPPVLEVAAPAVSTVEAEDFLLSGTSDAGAVITIQAPGQESYRVNADNSGRWQRTVPLNKGRNDFVVTATDPATSKTSSAINLIINVPLPQGPEAPTLSLTSPNDGTSFTNGAIPIQGTTTAREISVKGKWIGPTPGRGDEPSASPGAGSSARAPRAAIKRIRVRDDGRFSGSYQLVPGQWQLTITATGEQDKTTTERRTVSVEFTGVNLVIEIRESAAWIKVVVDGKVAEGYGAGRTLEPGKSVEFTARRNIEVRTGSSGSTFFTLNGQRLGALGPPGIPETWLFRPPDEPRRVR